MPRPLQGTDDLLVAVPAERHTIHDARARFTEWLSRHTSDPAVCDNLSIVVSELLANAIAAAEGHGPVVLQALHRRDDVHILVSNPTADDLAGADWDLDDPLRTGGRGLMIVEHFTDDVDVEIDLRASETTVRCHRSVG